MPPSADRRQSCPAPPHRCLSPAWCSLVMVRWRGLRTRSPTGNWRIPHPAARSPATQHQFVIFIVFATSPAQPPSSPLSPASVKVELTWGPATHLHKHHGHGSRGLVTSRQDTSTTIVSAAVLLIDQSSVEVASEDAGMPIMHAGL